MRYHKCKTTLYISFILGLVTSPSKLVFQAEICTEVAFGKLRSNIKMASGTALLDLAPIRDVLRILECPVCQDVMSPPVYQCATGHSICNICKPRLTECPLCKEKLSGTRNFIVEQLISSSVHECKWDGCKATAKGELIGEHIIACGFRPRPCPLQLLNDCRADLKHTDVLQHLKSIHKLDEKVSSSGEAEIRFSLDEYRQPDLKIDPNSHILGCHGNKFLVCMLSSQHNLHWAILLIANEAKKGSYHGEIILKLEEKREVRWTFPIVSVFNRTVMEYVLEKLGCSGAYHKQNIYQHCLARVDFKVVFKIRREEALQPKKQQPQQNSLSATIPVLQKWVSCFNGSVPGGALVGGMFHGEQAYVIRAEQNGAVIPGFLLASSRYATIHTDGVVQTKIEYEVLVTPAESVAWIQNSGGNIPDKAIPGGRSLNGELLYIGRANENSTPGAAYPGRCFSKITLLGQKRLVTKCEILVMKHGFQLSLR